MTEQAVKENGGVSRRSFLKGLATVGAGVAFISPALKMAKADSYGTFSAIDLSEAQLIEMQRKMLRIRWITRTMCDAGLTEEWLIARKPETHPVAGHEGTIIGAITALQPGDYQQGYHRSWGHAVGMGAEVKLIMAEAANMSTGLNKGYGGSLHLMDKEKGMLGEDGVVGPAVILGAGAAYGCRAKGEGQIVMGFMGEGTISTPYTWIAFHNATKHSLPYVGIVENNAYQGNKHFRYQSPLRNYTDIVAGLREKGMNSAIVDGMSALDVYSVTKAAVDRARAGDGPSLVECKCYRYYDHNKLTGVTPGTLGAWGLAYRSDREQAHWIAKDPVATHRRTLVAWDILSDAEADALEDEVIQECRDGLEFARTSPKPVSEDALKYVFMSPDDDPLPRQLATCPLY
jgi:pyruvate dehydrogenase E1 component alpha subunit